MPAHAAPQYQYAVHTPYAYPPYAQYPAGMVMYQAPAGVHPESSQQGSSSAPLPATGKRKRKYTHDGVNSRASDEEGADSSTDIQRGGSASVAPLVDNKKRTKTQRACDSCRSRKIRCDVLPDADPPVCQHCKQYSFECTFFLPITETRFKKKKMEEEAAAVAAAEKKDTAERSTSSPQAEHPKGGDIKVYGPTSTAHLLHSHPLVSSRTYEAYDLRYHHSWDLSADGDGIIRVHEPEQGELQLALPKPIDLRVERDVIEQLVNAYFSDVAPMLPVVTREEFIANNPPPPILLYSICLVAATRRDVPQKVFESIRYTVNSLIKAEDVLSTASVVNMQSLLVLAMVGDCHSQYVPHALSALWVRLGCAIRMAQDLGLHRAESVKQNIEMRRRLWGVCVISDRWYVLTFGHPYMIDIRDCDARLPSSGDPNDLYMDELVRLSVILGRVQKTIYTPAGLNLTNDEELHSLLGDIVAWKDNLPTDLQFRGPETPRSAGLLFMFYTCVNMIFWRVFMRISYSCPAHLKFSLTVEKWTGLVRMSGDAIDWLDANEAVYDVWLLVAYCATSCALIQYHTYARRQDPDAQMKLKKLRDCVRRWEAAHSPEHMSARRKAGRPRSQTTAEIIALLYEATQAPPAPGNDTPVLNPTGGVKGRPLLAALKFQKDGTRPGGGVFVAKGPVIDKELEKLPEGTIISTAGGGGGGDEGEALPVVSSAARPDNDSLRSSLSRSLHPSRSGSGSVVPMDAAAWSSASASAMVVDSAGAGSGSGARQQLQQQQQSQHRHHQQQQLQQQQQQQLQQQHVQDHTGAAMVNFSPLAASFPNMNPALNDQMAAPEQVMNVLDHPQAGSDGVLEQHAMADVGFLDGIPGTMFDWGQWDTFFARFAPGVQHAGFPPRMGGDVAMAGSPTSPQDAQNPRYFTGPGEHGL
ncbi:fungal-specific transcription factor domain-containing protein [Daedaleopsis nitida]|nr:fungal-specific transcription factor domain-containing protein [Daedaleopsis nitida]